MQITIAKIFQLLGVFLTFAGLVGEERLSLWESKIRAYIPVFTNFGFAKKAFTKVREFSGSILGGGCVFLYVFGNLCVCLTFVIVAVPVLGVELQWVSFLEIVPTSVYTKLARFLSFNQIISIFRFFLALLVVSFLIPFITFLIDFYNSVYNKYIRSWLERKIPSIRIQNKINVKRVEDTGFLPILTILIFIIFVISFRDGFLNFLRFSYLSIGIWLGILLLVFLIISLTGYLLAFVLMLISLVIRVLILPYQILDRLVTKFKLSSTILFIGLLFELVGILLDS